MSKFIKVTAVSEILTEKSAEAIIQYEREQHQLQQKFEDMGIQSSGEEDERPEEEFETVETSCYIKADRIELVIDDEEGNGSAIMFGDKTVSAKEKPEEVLKKIEELAQ